MKPTPKTTKKREAYTHEVRTKVPKSVGAELEGEAAREGLTVTAIVRRALVERYAAR